MFSDPIDVILVRVYILWKFNRKPGFLFQGSLLATSLESLLFAISF